VVNISELQTIYQKFSDDFDKKDFVSAVTQFEHLDLSLKKINDFSQLTNEDVNWLLFLQDEINDKLPLLFKEKKELVAKIKPFNDNKLKAGLYRGK
jgi:hypothetical protein